MFSILKHRANRCNIVGEQLPKLLDATCYIGLHTLLHVVGSCCTKFETGQIFEPTTPNISFVPLLPKRSATMLESLMRCILPTMHCRSQHCWELLSPFAHSFTVMPQIIKTVLLANRIIQVVLKRRRMHIAKIHRHLHQKTKRNLKQRKPVRELLRKTTSGQLFLCYLTMTGKLVGDCRIQWLGAFVLRKTFLG